MDNSDTWILGHMRKFETIPLQVYKLIPDTFNYIYKSLKKYLKVTKKLTIRTEYFYYVSMMTDDVFFFPRKHVKFLNKSKILISSSSILDVLLLDSFMLTWIWVSTLFWLSFDTDVLGYSWPPININKLKYHNVSSYVSVSSPSRSTIAPFRHFATK